MNDSSRDHIEQMVRYLAEIVASEQSRSKFRHYEDFLEYDYDIIIPEFDTAFNQLIKSILGNPAWAQKFSSEYIRRKIHALLTQICADGHLSNVSKYCNDFCTELDRFSESQTIYVLLSGIQLKVESLKFGKAVLKVFTEQSLDSLAEKFQRAQVIRSHSENSSIIGPKSVVLSMSQRQDFVNELLGLVYAEYSMVCEPIRAKEIAETETQRLLDILRFAVHVLNNPLKHRIARPKVHIYVGLYGETPPIARPATIVTTEDGRIYLHEDAAGTCFIINEQTLSSMRDMGIMQLAELIECKENELTEVQKILLRALHWFSNAQTESASEDKLLSLVTSLEAVLSPMDEKQIRSTIAERVARILEIRLESREGMQEVDDANVSEAQQRILESREEMKAAIKEMYSKRSRVSHGGHTVLLDFEVRYLMSITEEILLWLAHNQHNFRSRRSLEVCLNRTLDSQC